MDSVSRYLVGPTVDQSKDQTTAKPQVGCPIRRSLDQSPFPAPQCLSQGITSFIASCCQGIHQTPFSRLIRSRDGQALCRPFAARHALLRASRRSSGRKSYSFPAPRSGKTMGHWLVYLTWNKTAFGPPHGTQVAPTLGGTSGSDVSLSSRLSNPVRIGRDSALKRCLIGSREQMVEPVGIEPTTLCLQSRCSPS